VALGLPSPLPEDEHALAKPSVTTDETVESSRNDPAGLEIVSVFFIATLAS
jgi:hypothetical protein